MLGQVSETLLALMAGIAAGALNAIGGGGTFVALPALVAAGLSPATANASSTIALVPGTVVGAWVYRREITPVGTVPTRVLTMISVIGGACGAGMLLMLPAASFAAAIPWLLAFATVILAFGRRTTRALSTAIGRPVGMSPHGIVIVQFLLAVYGGYFGGAVGIMMLAVWSIGLGLDTSGGNPMRISQLTAIYLGAAAMFLMASDALHAPLLLATMLVGAAAGGLAGAHLARRLPARLLRHVILTTAAAMTVLYFLHG